MQFCVVNNDCSVLFFVADVCGGYFVVGIVSGVM